MVAKSSAEAGYRFVAHEICEVLWLKRLLKELKISMALTIKVYCDNKSTIAIAHNLFSFDRTKYVEIDKHFIRSKIDNGIICMFYHLSIK